MQTIVFLNHGSDELYTTSDLVAQLAKVTHHAVQQLISKYECDLKEFGRVAFEMRALKTKGGVQETKIYHLNEEQATLLITYLQNTPAVRALKKELVRQFYEMRSLIIELQSSIWHDTRQLGKQIRKEETDNIKKLVDYAKEHGSQNAARYYTSLSILADKAANITERDKATVDQLTTLRLVERLIAAEINEGIKMGQPYKSIYQACRVRLENYSAIAGLHHEKVGA